MGLGLTYAAYLAISAGLTVWVGWALSRSGRVFLTSVFGDESLASAVNRLLVVGFYLLSSGFVTVTLHAGGHISSVQQAVGVLSAKIGEELLVLGGLHLLNMLFFTRIRRRRQQPYQPAGPAARQALHGRS